MPLEICGSPCTALISCWNQNFKLTFLRFFCLFEISDKEAFDMEKVKNENRWKTTSQTNLKKSEFLGAALVTSVEKVASYFPHLACSFLS